MARQGIEAPPPFLTAYEVEVIEAIAAGAQSKEIAVALRRSKPTIEATVRILYAKLQARSRAHLVMRAVAMGVIEVQSEAKRA